MAHTPSIQQRAVYKWVRDETGNLILVAVAGAGKTTTVLNAVTLMRSVDYSGRGASVNICAYNRKIAEEINAKLKAANQPSRIQAGTFHSFGFRNWRKVAPNVKVVGRKVKDIVEGLKPIHEDHQEFIVSLVSLAKQRAFGILTPYSDRAEWQRIVEHYDVDEKLPQDATDKWKDPNQPDEKMEDMIQEGITWAIKVFEKSLEMDQEVIDYDDMILAPLIHNARIWQNDLVAVDEAQDTNPARREFAKRMMKPTGRAMFVGDPSQAIYGFTGADNDSLDIIKREFNCKELPLTVTYRCPKAVVAFANMWVSHIVAHESAPEGVVATITDQDFAKLTPDNFTKDAVMLCRNTAPLVATAYSLIRRGIACHVEGKAIGDGLLVFIEKFKTADLYKLQEKMKVFVNKEVEKFLKDNHEKKAEALTEKYECVQVLIQCLPHDAKVADLKVHIKNLFGDTKEGEQPDCFTLSTVHKSKGREWNTVYLLNRMELMPSRFAKQDWQMQQEENLIYVAVTRSKNTLVEVVKPRL